ncbi:MAG: Gfo/Idh/MocA family oxidoreductase [Phycisphaerales bacterium]|jgi:predicted dehydrogenase|nr:Gfo/Idh/MocA family oxidoreductase [Phycisphaerales bacterium]
MAIDITIVGGGMITHDQLLPSIYHLQRLGVVGKLQISALNAAPLQQLASSEAIKAAFPNQSFISSPSLDDEPSKMYPDLFKSIIEKMPPQQMVVVAVPDHFHYPVIKFALEHNQHVLTVKPLVLTYPQATEIEHLAHERGLFVGVEYHKRFDRRSLETRGRYRQGKFGDFRCGEAKLIEPWYYRHSNFQNWFTKENTDPFTYIGCHYVDLVYFITGLKPVEASIQGVEGTFPNGKVGYMWSAGRVTFENGGILSVINGLGYPDLGGGGNDQGMTLYCEGKDSGGLISHNDQFRGVQHGYIAEAGGKSFNYVNPDYMRLVPWEGEGLKPVGYGYDSVEASIRAAVRINDESKSAGNAALRRRQAILKEIDDNGIIATPSNSSINELVMEAGRLSILNQGRRVLISYGKSAGVKLA